VTVPAQAKTSPGTTTGTGPLLDVHDLAVEFRKGSQILQAVAGVSFSIEAGETLGLVGESGCGKSTTGRALVQIERPTRGSVVFDGVALEGLGRRDLRRARTGIQMIFQDPVSSLNPRRRVGKIVAEPLDIWGRGTPEERDHLVRDMLEAVGLDPDLVSDRRPREFSGGQCQRISIARALILEPKLLICDEVVSALDVSVQAQILNLLEDLKQRYGLTLLFIAHDLAVVKNVSDRVAVMYLGVICELAPAEELYERPLHPYTDALLGSALEPDPEAPPIGSHVRGEPPSPINPPSGCRFRTRCPYAQQRCADEVPELRELGPGHLVACHFAESLDLGARNGRPPLPKLGDEPSPYGGDKRAFSRVESQPKPTAGGQRRGSATTEPSN
jgi:peptide/nickel transport system ATP-binding protein